MKKFDKIFLVFTLSIVFSGLLTYIFPETKFSLEENSFSDVYNENNLRYSSSWQITGAGIYIDDSDINYNWQKTATDNEWCYGNGTWSDPYIIENVTINPQESEEGIVIKNSIAYFRIQNCTIYNSVYKGGIYLEATENGTIYNNTISYNDAVSTNGVWLSNCENVTVTENSIHDNRESGILTELGKNNTISKNRIYSNSKGIDFNIASSINMKIFDNLIFENEYSGIMINNYNIIYENVISDNGIGISIFDNHNLIINNTLINDKISLGGGYNNTISENYIKFSEGNPDPDDIGIELGGRNNTISSNYLYNCTIFHYGNSPEDFKPNNVETTNLVNGKPFYLFINETGLTSVNFLDAGTIVLLNCQDSVISNLDLNQLYLKLCTNITVQNNEFLYSGIIIRDSHYNIIKENNVESPFMGLLQSGGSGIFAYGSDFNLVSNNSIQNCISMGIIMWESNYNTIEYNIAEHTGVGIEIYWNCEGNTITQNTITYSTHGIRLTRARYNNITSNTANYNQDGIVFHIDADNNIVDSNQAHFNNYGINIDRSNFNTISNNNLIDNEVCIFIESSSIGNVLNNNICERPQTTVPGFNILLLIGLMSFTSMFLVRRFYKK